jgi:hypothetical protein
MRLSLINTNAMILRSLIHRIRVAAGDRQVAQRGRCRCRPRYFERLEARTFLSASVGVVPTEFQAGDWELRDIPLAPPADWLAVGAPVPHAPRPDISGFEAVEAMGRALIVDGGALRSEYTRQPTGTTAMELMGLSHAETGAVLFTIQDATLRSGATKAIMIPSPPELSGSMASLDHEVFFFALAPQPPFAQHSERSAAADADSLLSSTAIRATAPSSGAGTQSSWDGEVPPPVVAGANLSGGPSWLRFTRGEPPTELPPMAAVSLASFSPQNETRLSTSPTLELYDSVFQSYSIRQLSPSADLLEPRSASVRTYDHRRIVEDDQQQEGFAEIGQLNSLDEDVLSLDTVTKERNAVDEILADLHTLDEPVNKSVGKPAASAPRSETAANPERVPAFPAEDGASSASMPRDDEGGMVLLQVSGDANACKYDLVAAYQELVDDPSSTEANTQMSIGVVQAFDVGSEGPMSETDGTPHTVGRPQSHGNDDNDTASTRGNKRQPSQRVPAALSILTFAAGMFASCSPSRPPRLRSQDDKSTGRGSSATQRANN